MNLMLLVIMMQFVMTMMVQGAEQLAADSRFTVRAECYFFFVPAFFMFVKTHVRPSCTPSPVRPEHG